MDGGLGTVLIGNTGLRFPPSPSQFPLPEESQSWKKGRMPLINVSQKLQPSHYSTAMAPFISPPSAWACLVRWQPPAPALLQGEGGPQQHPTPLISHCSLQNRLSPCPMHPVSQGKPHMGRGFALWDKAGPSPSIFSLDWIMNC